MGVPMVVREKREGYSDTRSTYSAYDDHADNTDPEAVLSRGATSAVNTTQFNPRRRTTEPVQWKRWKYDSPWIAGMQPGEFEIYVQSRLQSRRGDFRDFMIRRLQHQRVQDEERRLRDMGQRRSLSSSRKNAILLEITANYETEEKRLRDEHAVQHLASEMTAAIIDFLDLPGVRDLEESNVQAKTPAFQNALQSMATETTAPPSTHPAAGLSHLRTNAIMENHPFWGPQGYPSPVLARVVRPRNNAYGQEHQAKLGVGGVVANDKSVAPQGAGSGWPRNDIPLDVEPDDIGKYYLDADRMTNAIEVDLPGGNKIWVHPETASVDDQGGIRLLVNRGDKEAIAITRNDVQAIHQAKRAALSSPSTSSSPRGTAGNANYGFSLPDTRYRSPKSHVRGFDDQLRRGPQQERMEEETSAIGRIKELMPRR